MTGRGIRNVHERVVDADADAVGALVDSLSSKDDRLWPTPRWPPMRLDRGLGIGSDGGHGPVRYEVARYEPGRLAAFAFTAKFPIEGEHRVEVFPAPGSRTLLIHTLEGKPKSWLRLGWPLCFRWLHDALIEDAFDRAEAELAGSEWQPRPLPVHVRALRWLAGRLGGRR